jgi:hypothetical protein
VPSSARLRSAWVWGRRRGAGRLDRLERGRVAFRSDYGHTNTSTHIVGSEGGAAYEILIECVMPPRSYAIFIIRRE